MSESLYIVQVLEDGEIYDYEYGNITHAEEHYNSEKSASLIEYKDGNHIYRLFYICNKLSY
jgi:hypothetical protein